ncbi:DNA-directed DNA polymerase, partial [Tanacetum coccineum]
MAETMKQYMSKTRMDYGSGVARTKVDNKDQFELKGQFLKELRENTFSGLDNEDANEHIEKVLERVDLFHVPNITEVILFYNGLDIPGPHYTKDFPLKEDGKTLEEAYYTQFGRPCQGGGYRATALGYYQRNNANPSYQERRQSMEDTLSKFMSESTKRHEENSNLIKEIRATTDAAIRNQGASIKTLEIQIEQMSKVPQERGFGSLPSSTETNPRDQVKSISTTIEADSYLIRRASISVMPLLTYINLGLGELALTRLTVELADRTVKYSKGIAENILVGSGKFTFPIGFIILDMLEDTKVPLILERPFLSTAQSKIDVFKDYIELNDLNEPIELRRNQGDDLMPTIKEGEVIEEFRTRDEDLDTGMDDYP